MGFYVNLEMPKNCPMCPFAHYDDMFNTFRGCDITRGKRWAVKNDKDYAKLSTRPDWCPLIEVPEPHVRLIDADALKTDCDLVHSMMIFGGQMVYTQSAIDNAPTIVESEPCNDLAKPNNDAEEGK